MTEIEELRAARVQVNVLAEAINLEMIDQGHKGHFWQNHMCKAWPDYERAVEYQKILRAKYGV